jgi:uncharacterized membrane protein YjjB (DUF3815 family)
MSTHWIRIFGSLLIALGISVFVGSILAALVHFIYMLFVNADYISAVTLSSLTLICFGFILRRIVKEPK